MAIKFGRPIEMRDAPRRQTALASTPLDLAIRPRRNRKAEWARRLVRENVLTTERSDLADVRGRRPATRARRSPRCPASTASPSIRRCATPSAR